jgi:hypothetical protein
MDSGIARPSESDSHRLQARPVAPRRSGAPAAAPRYATQVVFAIVPRPRDADAGLPRVTCAATRNWNSRIAAAFNCSVTSATAAAHPIPISASATADRAARQSLRVESASQASPAGLLNRPRTSHPAQNRRAFAEISAAFSMQRPCHGAHRPGDRAFSD